MDIDIHMDILYLYISILYMIIYISIRLFCIIYKYKNLLINIIINRDIDNYKKSS